MRKKYFGSDEDNGGKVTIDLTIGPQGGLNLLDWLELDLTVLSINVFHLEFGPDSNEDNNEWFNGDFINSLGLTAIFFGGKIENKISVNNEGEYVPGSQEKSLEGSVIIPGATQVEYKKTYGVLEEAEEVSFKSTLELKMIIGLKIEAENKIYSSEDFGD